ncbi:heterokaryon incompatibility protein-domain-containing protein [Dichomitus squalens]|uniref:Heterokaryon incompatibility protein-domain-containing protein n=1 Tax=Dichomitus squalens TaxID=114155 RepID=A0A4Q9MEM9_9APHY|nr:heterokaryon incompatibility protein-domain-containing protein [Dichomitus squalens]
MWLLSTDRAELHYHHNPEGVPAGYAILSHVWGSSEQTFQDVKRIQAECLERDKSDARQPSNGNSRTNTNPRDHVSEKIRQSCLIAERHGYRWIWNDTCCIDKTSSSELSEAINSMHRYYSLAEVCYAYLADVTWGSSDEVARYFRESKWHKRGWTLQELIAPNFLIFLSGNWGILGTKHGLASVLESITRIPASLLRNEEDIGSFSAAQRMSWAADRETTRVEDQAYSLLGIFGIHMTTLYGEGTRAFERLQEKIIKTSVDTSIFAWGARIDWDALCATEETLHHGHDHNRSDSYLLCSSPKHFRRASQVCFSPSPSLLPRKHEVPEAIEWGVLEKPRPSRQKSIPACSITQYGVSCHIPIFDTASLSIAVLFSRDQQGHLGLILTPCPNSIDPLLPLYHTGYPLYNGGEIARVVGLGKKLDALRFLDQPVDFTWKEVYIAIRPPSSSNPIPRRVYARSSFPPFRLSQHICRTLSNSGWELSRQPTIPHGVADSESVDVSFCRAGPERVRLVFAMGLCSSLSTTALASSESASAGSYKHWASFWVIPSGLPDDYQPPSHRCPADHISLWPDHKKLFAEQYADYHYPFAVRFTPCPANPRETLVLSQAREGLKYRFGLSGFAVTT